MVLPLDSAIFGDIVNVGTISHFLRLRDLSLTVTYFAGS